MFHVDAASNTETRQRLNDVGQNGVNQTPVYLASQNIASKEGEARAAEFAVCVFHNHSIIIKAVLYTERLNCTEQRAFSSRQTTLQIDTDVYLETERLRTSRCVTFPSVS